MEAQTILTAIDQAIHDYITSGAIQKKTIEGTGVNLEKVSLDSLMALRSYYQKLVNSSSGYYGAKKVVYRV